MAARRRPRSAAQRPRQRAASVFLAIGCLTVLAVTFALGVAAGRRWPNGMPWTATAGSPTAVASARPEREAGRRPETRGLDKDKVSPRADSATPLTFYQELTAPLAAPPASVSARPATKPVRSEAKAVDAAKPPQRPSEARKPETPAAAESPARERAEGSPAASPGDAGGARFTVQVGSFKARAQAEALRAKLAETGQDAYVSEVEVAGVAQYRVRVGSFTTREAARDAATRLAGERRMTTYVTTR